MVIRRCRFGGNDRGAVLETTGITPRVLSYIQDGSATGIASAMSTSATVLLRGNVLPTDFYASVSDFTVPATVARDFSNNATISSTGGIRPYWEGNTFVIPSAPLLPMLSQTLTSH